jgi:multidrug efflux pump subunit AcrB
MVVLGVVVFGALSFRRLPLNLMPTMNYPRLTVRTEYPGSGPEEVELELSRPIESALSTVRNLVRITSRSRAGLSEVTIEFDWGTQMDLAMQEVREKLDLLRYPTDSKRPILLRYDPNLEPMLRVGLSGKGNLFRLRQYAEDVLQPALETLPGVAAVKIRGGLEREVEIALDEKKIRSLNLSIKKVSQRLKEENINLAGGRLKEGVAYYWVRTLNEFLTLSDMGNLIIEERDSKKIYLRDIARIRFHAKEQEIITRVNGKIAIELAIFREAGANIVEVSKRVRARIFGTPDQIAYVIKMEKNANKKKKSGKWGRGKWGRGKSGQGRWGKGKKRRWTNTHGRQGKAKAHWRKQMRGRWNKMSPAQKAKLKARLQKMTPAQRRRWRKRSMSRMSKGKKGRWGKSKKGRWGKGKKGRWGKGKKGRKGRRKSWRERRRMRMLKRQMTGFVLYTLPGDMNMKVLQDQATFIEAAVNEVLSAAFIGGVIAVFVLLLFMRDLWSTLIISLSIPLSVVATFGGMYLSDISLNIMSLGGLALGIGMLVDNSIVVLENIFRLREDGASIEDSAVRGVAEVGGAVTASTLTTVAVFFPIVFVQGVAGQLLRDLALTVVLSLLSSLVVSLFFIPMLSAIHQPDPDSLQNKGQGWSLLAWVRFRDGMGWWGSAFKGAGLFKKLLLVVWLPFHFAYQLFSALVQLGLDLLSGLWALSSGLFLLALRLLWLIGGIVMTLVWKPVFWVMDRFLNFLDWFYPRLLSGALQRRETVIALCLLLGGITYVLSGTIKTEFMPKVHQGEFNLEMTFKLGTPLQRTDKTLRPIEKKLRKLKAIREITSVIGVEKTEVKNSEKGEHSATLTVRLKPSRNIETTELRTLDQIRGYLGSIPDLRSKVVFPSLFSLRTPIEVVLKGQELRTLRKISDQIVAAMRQIPSLRDVRSSAVGGLPEVQLHYNRERLLKYGLSVQDVAQAIRDKVLGTVATRYRKKERRLDVLVRVKRKQLKTLQSLMNLSVRNNRGESITLSQIATLKKDEGPSQILRVGNQRAVLIHAELQGVALGDATMAIEDKLRNIPMPDGYSVKMGGQSQEMNKSLTSLLYALLLSIFLVYLVMASQFESLASPFLILGSIPLAFIGVIGILWFLNMPMSVMVLIGLIILSGIVVNNAIVLLDAVGRLQEEGLEPLEALKAAGKLRLRPILMTTATTALGLLPLALGLGEGAELRRPMAITIMAGLLASTLLTLVVIPVLYRMFLIRTSAPPSAPQ